LTIQAVAICACRCRSRSHQMPSFCDASANCDAASLRDLPLCAKARHRWQKRHSSPRAGIVRPHIAPLGLCNTLDLAIFDAGRLRDLRFRAETRQRWQIRQRRPRIGMSRALAPAGAGFARPYSAAEAAPRADAPTTFEKGASRPRPRGTQPKTATTRANAGPNLLNQPIDPRPRPSTGSFGARLPLPHLLANLATQPATRCILPRLDWLVRQRPAGLRFGGTPRDIGPGPGAPNPAAPPHRV
jgi:hypothetical protein